MQKLDEPGGGRQSSQVVAAFFIALSAEIPGDFDAEPPAAKTFVRLSPHGS